jgi:WD40 repeat protein
MQQRPVSVRVVQLRFHWTDRAEGITSVDFHPTKAQLLTAGCDGSVKVWNFDVAEAHRALPDDASDLQSVLNFASVITTDEHPTPNAARWSPLGSLIVAPYVNGDVIVWKPAAYTTGYFDATDERSLNTEHWAVHKTMKLSSEAVDANFSPCSRYVVSCCVQGSIFVHSTESGQIMQHLTPDDAHQHDCQYVAFDPLGLLVSSFGADRVLKFYSVVAKKHGVGLRPLSSVDKGKDVNHLFKGGMSTYRRGSWSPDGAVFACPHGWEKHEDEEFRDCLYLFSRAELGKHFAYLSTQGKKNVSGCRFAPFVIAGYGDNDDANTDGTAPDTTNGLDMVAHDSDSLSMRQALGSWGPMSYRYVLAVWTRESVSIYTSGSSAKVCRLYDLHYDIINDVAFTRDAQFLCVSSNDGYITLSRFKSPLGKLVRVQDGRDALSRAVSMVLDPLLVEAAALEGSVAAPLLQTGTAGSTTVVAVVKKKKDKDKKKAATVTSDNAADEGTAKRERTPSAVRELNAEREDPKQPAAEVVEASGPIAELGADELAALMDD